jgi:hypothetical protein
MVGPLCAVDGDVRADAAVDAGLRSQVVAVGEIGPVDLIARCLSRVTGEPDV